MIIFLIFGNDNNIAATINPTQQQSLKVRCMLASIESLSAAKVVYNDLTILYWRDVNLNLKFNITANITGWINY